jgi:hypothetical protein
MGVVFAGVDWAVFEGASEAAIPFMGLARAGNELQTMIGQLTDQNHLVNPLQKARPKLPMDMNRRFEHPCANLVLSHPNTILCASARV